MTSSTSKRRPGEFELIRKLFAPLSRGLAGAHELTDDAATVTPPAGHDVVLKTDAIVEGVHFLRDDPPEAIAKKALRVNLSDFAAKGASPHAYLLALALPDWPDFEWLKSFARGLGEDQSDFAVVLAGGDTVRTPSALTVAITLTGFVPSGRMLRRAGAKPGDRVFVTGTMGDAGAGLALLRERASGHAVETLIARYRLPEPRLALGLCLRDMASAALDVSDGLLADLEHIADTSGVRIEVDADRVPLSGAYVALRGRSTASLIQAATAGDDYEIAFTAPPEMRPEIEAAATRTSTSVTEIGRVTKGDAVCLLDAAGREVPVGKKGYAHF